MNKKEYQLQRAAEAGDVDAMVNLERYYWRNVKRNKEYGALARKWALRAARKGHMAGMSDMGDFHYYGFCGVKRSYRKGFLWYSKAAELGYAYAMNSLSICYQEGKGTKRDIKKGLEWTRKAAALGDAEGQNMLGVFLFAGRGTRRDKKGAMEMFRAAAKQGEACGLCNYADCFRSGITVTKNYKKALYYYRKSVQKGNLYSKYRIGEMTMKGMGVKKMSRRGTSSLKRPLARGAVKLSLICMNFIVTRTPASPDATWVVLSVG